MRSVIETPEELFEQHYRHLVKFAHRQLRTTLEDAEDCVQDAAIRIVRGWNQRQSPEKTLSWAMTVVANQTRDWHRKAKARHRADHVPLDLVLKHPSQPSHESQVFARITIRTAARELTPSEARALRHLQTGEGKLCKLAHFRMRIRMRKAIR